MSVSVYRTRKLPRSRPRERRIFEYPDRAVERTSFPLTPLRVAGLVLTVLAGLLFLFGFVAIGLNPCSGSIVGIINGCENVTLRDIGIGIVVAIAPWVLVTGLVGLSISPSRRNLEALRNTLLAMSLASTLLCLALAVYEAVLTAAWYQNLPDTMTQTQEANYGIWIFLVILLMLSGVASGVTSSLACCCSPGFCTPIVDKNGRVFTYDSSVGYDDLDIHIIRERKRRPYVIEDERFDDVYLRRTYSDIPRRSRRAVDLYY